MSAPEHGSPDERAPAGASPEGSRFRWWQLTGLTLVGAVILVIVAAAPWEHASVAAGATYVTGFVIWPLFWQRQRRAGRPVWWLVVVWPVAPLTFVGIAIWSLLELLGSF